MRARTGLCMLNILSQLSAIPKRAPNLHVSHHLGSSKIYPIHQSHIVVEKYYIDLYCRLKGALILRWTAETLEQWHYVSKVWGVAVLTLGLGCNCLAPPNKFAQVTTDLLGIPLDHGWHSRNSASYPATAVKDHEGPSNFPVEPNRIRFILSTRRSTFRPMKAWRLLLFFTLLNLERFENMDRYGSLTCYLPPLPLLSFRVFNTSTCQKNLASLFKRPMYGRATSFFKQLVASINEGTPIAGWFMEKTWKNHLEMDDDWG